MNKFKFSSLFFLLFLLAIHPGCTQPESTPKHIVIIGIDGMGSFGLQNSETSTMDSLMAAGAFTLKARNVMPTSSSSNWASMLMGAGPEQHGITSNAWQRNDHELPAIMTGPSGIFPTIFSVVKSNNPNSITGAVYQWNDFGRLFEKEYVDYDTSGLSENSTTRLAADFLKNEKPTFTFIHIDHVDGAGHKFRYDSKKYFKGITKADMLVNDILSALKDGGILEETLVIISADHGGKDKGHGGTSIGEVEIPVIIAGRGIKSGSRINSYVNIYDIPATAVYAFGYQLPEAWIGKPIVEVFK